MPMPEIIAARFSLRLLLAVLTGVLLAVSFPNVALGPASFVALIPLFVALTKTSKAREAFILGWFFYATTWLINVPWVINVMSKYGGLPKPLGITLYVMMALLLGTYGALFAIAVFVARPGRSFFSWLLIPTLWVAIEFLRTFLITGFPWNLIATTLIDTPPLVQPLRLIGPYALGFLLLLPSTLLAWMICVVPPRRQGLLAAFWVVGILVGWYGLGLFMLRAQDAKRDAVTSKVALLQPNITQEMRWNPQQALDLFVEMEKLTNASVVAGAEVIVWPESTVPLTFATTGFYRQTIEEISRRSNTDIILGSVAEDPSNPSRFWNAAYLVSAGRVQGRYDKIHLVPFGEYVPLRKMLFFAEKLVRHVGDFQFGSSETPLIGRFKYGPAICYEVIYPRVTAKQVRHGATVLVTITNDAWFDLGSAPRQHLNMARMRAVETDRYLLRAATTGISALIDPTGRIVDSLSLKKKGIVFGEFSPRQSITPYVRFGDWFGAAVVVSSALIVLGRALRFRKRVVSR